MPGAALPAGKVLRPLRDVSYGSVGRSAAWTRFTHAAGGAWEASWDRATGVPTQIWGSGILAPGAMQSAELAALYARAWLAAHVDLLAPGAAAADFVLVANTTDGDIRAVGFAQHAGGLPVLGGQIGFEFKADRLFVIASTALPDVPGALTAVAAAPITDAVRAAALPRLRAQLGLPATARASDLGAALVVPLVAADGVLGYRVARPITLDAGATGRYLAYVDPATGAPIAARQQDMFDTATVVYSGVDRYPERGRVDQPAPLAHVALGGVPQTTAHDGTVTVTGAQTLTTAVLGDLVVIHNEGTTGMPVTTTLPIAPGETARWDASAVPQDDAQVVTYLAINTVKDFVRANVDAQMPTLDDAITANVNIDQQCNAFFDGTAVNFFQASSMCQNTGLINDVMFHEFGHSLHENEIIAGVGAFDGAMSEGAADTLAVNITGDSGLGRGFFYTDAPLRELNPVGSEATWPADIGEIHHTGLIFGGTWWDLRATLQGELGAAAGEALTLQLYVGALRRSVDIPSSLIATLATDDDDGDLANGTPHECEIREAYARHGLHTASGAVLGPSRIDGRVPRARDPGRHRGDRPRRPLRVGRTRRRGRAVDRGTRERSAGGQRGRHRGRARRVLRAAAAADRRRAHLQRDDRVRRWQRARAARQPRGSVLPGLPGPHGASRVHGLRERRPAAGGLDHERGQRARRPLRGACPAAAARAIRRPRSRARTRSCRRRAATTRPIRSRR